jgi:hypothetical protein
VHVVVTYAFLRSLARLDLAESRVGRLAPIAAAPVGSDGAGAAEGGGVDGAPAASRSGRR